MNHSKEIFLPFATPVLDTYGFTWAREALTRAMVIGVKSRSTAAASLISIDGLLLSRLCPSSGEAASHHSQSVPGFAHI